MQQTQPNRKSLVFTGLFWGSIITWILLFNFSPTPSSSLSELPLFQLVAENKQPTDKPAAVINGDLDKKKNTLEFVKEEKVVKEEKKSPTKVETDPKNGNLKKGDAEPLTQGKVGQKEVTSFKMPENFQKPLRIGVIVTANEITKINEVTNTFEGSIDITLTWHDPNETFDPKITGTNRLTFNEDAAVEKLKKIWNPDIAIANIDKVAIKQHPSLMINADGLVHYLQRVNGTFESTYHLEPFPFDNQFLNINLISRSYDISQLQFEQTQDEINHSGIREGARISGWDLRDLNFFVTNEKGLNGNYFSEFQANILVRRIPLSHLFYLAPLLLIIIVPTIITFFSKSDVPTRLNNWAGSMLALIALSFTLTLRYPALPSNGILAQLIAIIFGYQFMMILLSKTLLDPTLQENSKYRYLLEELVLFLRWGIPLGVVTLIVARVLLVSLT